VYQVKSSNGLKEVESVLL